jgi:tetratricopeptide (TPR) repeat protein
MTGEYEKVSDFPAELRLDDQLGPASHITRGKADAMIEGALLVAGFGAPGAKASSREEVEIEVEAEPVTTQQKRKRPVALWQAAAAAVVVFAGIGSASAAIMWFAKRPVPVVEQLEEPAVKPRKTRQVRVAAPVEEAVAAEPEPIIEQPSSEPSVIEKPRHVRERKPEDWLEEANQLRARKKWKEADEAYAKVWQTAPKSDAAYVARIAAAGLRLDHLGDPRTALVRYRAALKASSRGALSEEARFGIAEAFRKLDDTEREVASLREFLAKHPEAGLAPKAKARLSALGEAL